MFRLIKKNFNDFLITDLGHDNAIYIMDSPSSTTLKSTHSFNGYPSTNPQTNGHTNGLTNYNSHSVPRLRHNGELLTNGNAPNDSILGNGAVRRAKSDADVNKSKNKDLRRRSSEENKPMEFLVVNPHFSSGEDIDDSFITKL